LHNGTDEGRGSAQTTAPGSGAAPTTIALCGELQAQIGGRDVSGLLPGRQGRALFAFLVLNRHHSASRDELIDALWPARPPSSPTAGLSSVLARVRRAIGPGVIAGRAQLVVRFDVDSEIDVETAVAAVPDAQRYLEAGDPKAAIALVDVALDIVGRRLLPEFDEPWVEAKRRELDALKPALLELRTRAGLTLGGVELAGAELTARTLAERYPYRESGHALLMEAQARHGNVAEAMQTYQRLRELLRDELGTAPSPSVVALHDRLLRSGSLEEAPAPAPAPPVAAAWIPLPSLGSGGGDRPFVGRQGALELLGTTWERATGGRLQFVVLVGEHGVGKTQLAARFARDMHSRGALVLYGRCDEEAIVAYQPFVEALRHALRHNDLASTAQLAGSLRTLGRLVPEARGSQVADHAEEPDSDAGEMGRFILFEAVCRILRYLASQQPALLILDDLHWADQPTLKLLRHMIRDLETSSLMVLGAFRGEEVPRDAGLAGVLADLRREHPLVRVRLGGLDEEAADELVATRLNSRQTPAFVRALHSETAGNPFFMHEVLLSLQESGALAEGAQAPEHALDRMGVPAGVEEVISRRLARMSATAVNALTVAAILGNRFELGTVREVLAEPDEAVVAALEEAIEAGLIVEESERIDGLTFCHGILREAIYSRPTKSRRARLHQRVGEVLVPQVAAGRVTAAEIAHHVLLAGPLAEPQQAARYAIQAGDDAARSLAWEEAELHYQRALDAWQELDDEREAWRCDVLLSLARVQARAGSSRSSRATALRAAQSARARDAHEQLARAALGLGERYWEANVADRTYGKLLVEALRSLDDADSTLRARVLARLAENLHFSAEQGRGAGLSAEAVEMARRLNDKDALVTALMARHVVLLHADHLDERLRIIDEVLTCSASRSALAHAQQWRVYDLCEAARIDEAREQHLRLVEMSNMLRQPMFSLAATGWQGVFAALDGDIAQTELFAREALDVAQRAEASDARSIHTGILFMVRRWQGRVTDLIADVQALSAGPDALAPWRAAFALVLIESGAVKEGRAEYEQLARKRFDMVPQNFHWLGTMALLTEACAALGDTVGAAVLYERLRPFAQRFVQMSYISCWGSVERYLGLLAGTLGDLDAARSHCEAALHANSRAGAVLLVAATQQQYARWLGQDERGAELRTQAAALAEQRGLPGLAKP
jgi:DNA-binding SARP family transcriptional activator/tetratricopeptide (TPR) repeat protein